MTGADGGRSRTFARAVAELRGRRAAFVWATAVALVEAVGMLGLPLLQRALYDEVLIGGRTDLVAPVLVSMLLLVMTMMGARGLSTYLFAAVSENVKLQLRARLAAHAATRPIADDLVTGRQVSIATNDVDEMTVLYRHVLGQAIVQCLWLLGTLVVLAVIDPRLLLVAFPLLALYALLPLAITPALRRAGTQVQDRTARLVGTLHETFASGRDIRAFGRANWAVRRQHDDGDRLRDAELHRTKLEVATLGGSVVYWVSVVAISWYGAFAVTRGELTVGSLLALLLYFGQLQMPVSFLISANTRLQTCLAAADRVFAYVDPATKATMPTVQDVVVDGIWRGAGSIEVDDVTFRYPGQTRCIEGVSLAARPGEFVAVVGETGSGKTTLLQLLLGFVDPQRGDVRVDGRTLHDHGEDELRRIVSLSSSGSVLFDMTVADNIRFGRLDAGDNEVAAAAWAAAADGFVAQLPDGYGTSIGERGERLSTGQRQRLALARALIRRPSVLLLDEATSGLDGPTEQLVLDRLLERPDRPTIVMVTHRLHALTRADRVYVLEAGKVVQEGNHAGLLTQNGTYQRLHERQHLDARGDVEASRLVEQPPLGESDGSVSRPAGTP